MIQIIEGSFRMLAAIRRPVKRDHCRERTLEFVSFGNLDLEPDNTVQIRCREMIPASLNPSEFRIAKPERSGILREVSHGWFLRDPSRILSRILSVFR